MRQSVFRRPDVLSGDDDGLVCGHDNAAAQADVAVIQHGGLTGRYRPLRFVEHQLDRFIIEITQFAGRVRHAVAGFAGVAPFSRPFGQGETQIVHDEAAGIEQRMVMTLYDDEFVFRQILRSDKPRLARAADAQSFALSERVEHQSDVFADGFAFGRYHFAVVGRQVFLQELAERTFADEADAGTVFFGGSRQIEFGGKAADFRFFQITQRENRALELERLEAVKEIALVFILIQTFKQVMSAVADFFARIVSGGNGIRALLYGIVQKAFEFDFGIAQHIRIRRAPRAVFFEKIGEYVVFVLGGKIDDVDVYADDVGDGNGIERVLLDAAIFVIVVVLPVLHKHTAHLITLLFEQGGGYGGIDTAGESDDDVLLCVVDVHAWEVEMR